VSRRSILGDGECHAAASWSTRSVTPRRLERQGVSRGVPGWQPQSKLSVTLRCAASDDATFLPNLGFHAGPPGPLGSVRRCRLGRQGGSSTAVGGNRECHSPPSLDGAKCINRQIAEPDVNTKFLLHVVHCCTKSVGMPRLSFCKRKGGTNLMPVYLETKATCNCEFVSMSSFYGFYFCGGLKMPSKLSYSFLHDEKN